jgi:hypothetical protein
MRTFKRPSIYLVEPYLGIKQRLIDSHFQLLPKAPSTLDLTK